MILTLNIPEYLADQLRNAAAAEGADMNNCAVSRLERSFAIDEQKDEPDRETIAALQEVIDDYNRGERGRPVREFMAELDATYGQIPVSSKAQ